MARIGRGEWIRQATLLREKTAGMSPAERRRCLEQEHQAGGRAAHTAHRMMNALDWVLKKMQTYHVGGLEKVVISYTAVEMLMKLEIARPEQAARIVGDALLGHHTTQEIKTMTSAGRRGVKGRSSFYPNEWEVFLIEEIWPLLPWKGELDDHVKNQSEWARTLKIDIEWRGDDGKKIAILISPSVGFAQHATFSEVLPRLMAALTIYDEVIYYTLDREELDLLELYSVERERPLGQLMLRGGHPAFDLTKSPNSAPQPTSGNRKRRKEGR